MQLVSSSTRHFWNREAELAGPAPWSYTQPRGGGS
jgi:hypothetical protein